MTWWYCGGGGVLELDGFDVELELRFADARTVAWWVRARAE
jgi:hypothetical protein